MEPILTEVIKKAASYSLDTAKTLPRALHALLKDKQIEISTLIKFRDICVKARLDDHVRA